jgi:hypothetical protein
MDVKKIKVGRSYPYDATTRTGVLQGAGKVTEVKPVAKGFYVSLFDEKKNRVVSVRPSQVG